MASPQPSAKSNEPALPPVKLDLLAALLSYLIPGLGQIYQGRVGKGLLFFGGLYLLFFYGMWMGQWKNVWLPTTADLPEVDISVRGVGFRPEGVLKSLIYRPQFAAQFCIGVAAWPALYQYVNYEPTKKVGPVFGKFQRMPTEDELNELQRNSSKVWDLGWVYTVIAGVLNLLVIYDAFAGPMFRDPPKLAEHATEPLPLPPPDQPIAAHAAPVPEAPSPASAQGGSP